jgi:hypothetical protein
MTDNYKVAEKEREGRDKVLSVFGGKIDFTQSPKKYDSWDMSAVTYSHVDLTDKNIFVEVKDRKCKSTSFPTAFLEIGKLEKLSGLAKTYDAEIFYICTYTDGLMYAFNLKNINLLQIGFTIKNTEHETYSSTKVMVDKVFIDLPFHLGKRYRIKN